jgi:AraC-like DNA-binding protein
MPMPLSRSVRIVRFTTDDIPGRDRVSTFREIYGRTIVKHDVEPEPDHPFHCSATIYALPELAQASVTISPARCPRRLEHIDSDDLVLNITLSGGRTVRQLAREAVVGTGEAVLTTGADPGIVTVHATSRTFSLRMPYRTLTPMVSDLDARLLRPVRRDSYALGLLIDYAGMVQSRELLAVPSMQQLVVAHVHDLVALMLGATRDAAELARGRGVRAARLRAIKADVMNNLSRADLGPESVAARHGISSRYIHKLFESEGATFSEFVNEHRLIRAHRMLREPGHLGHTIGAIAFACGFGDMSYFNRLFRRRLGATPSDVRQTGPSDFGE